MATAGSLSAAPRRPAVPRASHQAWLHGQVPPHLWLPGVCLRGTQLVIVAEPLQLGVALRRWCVLLAMLHLETAVPTAAVVVAAFYMPCDWFISDWLCRGAGCAGLVEGWH